MTVPLQMLIIVLLMLLKSGYSFLLPNYENPDYINLKCSEFYQHFDVVNLATTPRNRSINMSNCRPLRLQEEISNHSAVGQIVSSCLCLARKTETQLILNKTEVKSKSNGINSHSKQSDKTTTLIKASANKNTVTGVWQNVFISIMNTTTKKCNGTSINPCR